MIYMRESVISSLKQEEAEKVLDVIELSFKCIDPDIYAMDSRDFRPDESPPDKAIAELNYRFREHGVGYQYESGQIVKD